MSAYSDVPHLNRFCSYSKIGNPLGKVISYTKSWRALLAYCLEEKIDIVHIQWCVFSPVDWKYHQLLRKHGIRIVVTIHDLLPFNKKFYDPYYHRKIYAHADKVINQAHVNQETLLRDYGVSPDRLVYIPHGHYMDYAEPATREESRAYLKLPEDRPVILFFGQIKKVKGVGVLIRAMRQVVQAHPDVLCLIAGKVWHDDFSKYQALIDSLGLQEFIRTDIRFIDDDEIKYYFNAADMVALPYLQIYQSGVVLLAYAYETPVVATTEGELVMVVRDKETGLLVPSGDETALAEALNWYLDHPQEAAAFAHAGKKDLSVRLSWDRIARDIAEIYAQCSR